MNPQDNKDKTKQNNIQVSVQTRYMDNESNPEAKHFVFAYQIRLKNIGSTGARLIDRHWFIANEFGQTEEVIGDGVIGKQPHLQPGEEFTYTSGAVLGTATGSMRGSYGMLNDAHESFEAIIPEFMLLGPRILH